MAKAKPEVEVKVYPEKIEALIANDLNPRTISKKKYEALKKSLKDFPEMKQLREIVVDENLAILAGHQRIYALKDLGYTDVTVKQVFGLTEAQKREFMIKDNTNSGDWDTDALANHWSDLGDKLQDWGLPDFTKSGGDGEGEHTNTSKDRSVTCPACYHEFPLSESANNE